MGDKSERRPVSYAEEAKFIEVDLLPEMVHNRCFCQAASREFVEFDSAKVEPHDNSFKNLHFNVYRATLVVLFSGEPQTFHLLVQLLPEGEDSALAYDAFLNEEMLCNKARSQFGLEFFPQFYVADMGRYGRPVIVIEDLERNGFRNVEGETLSGDEGEALAIFLAKFHAKGMHLKKSKFSVYREFCAKFQEIVLADQRDEENQRIFLELRNEEQSESLAKLLKEKDYGQIKEILRKREHEDESVSICQGLLEPWNLWFKKQEDRVSQVRIMDWHLVRQASPALDLSQVLQHCDREHRNHVLRVYTETYEKEHSSIVDSDSLALGSIYARFAASI